MNSIESIELLGGQANFGPNADLSPLGADASLSNAFAAGDQQEIQRLAGSTKPMMMVLIPADEEDSDAPSDDKKDESATGLNP